MENEMEEIKIKTNKLYFDSKENLKSKLKTIQFLNYINILLIILLIILIIKDKIYSFQYPIKQNVETNNNINLSEKIRILKLLTNNDELEYKGVQKCLLNDPDQLFCIYHLIIPKEVIGKKRILLGDKSDGCYVLLDDFENIKIAYSFGISTNIQFDKALADKGIDVYMYDHTINSLPYQNPKFHWKKLGICGIGKRYNDKKNLEEILLENGHNNEQNMILKMDVDYGEWEAILNLKEETLDKFKYIAIEYHFKERNFYTDENLYYNIE